MSLNFEEKQQKMSFQYLKGGRGFNNLPHLDLFSSAAIGHTLKFMEKN